MWLQDQHGWMGPGGGAGGGPMWAGEQEEGAMVQGQGREGSGEAGWGLQTPYPEDGGQLW